MTKPTRKEIEVEYDRLVNGQLPGAPPDRSFELTAVLNCLQWVLFGTGEKPHKWLAMREVPDTPESVAEKMKSARGFGDMFESLGRTEKR